MPGVIPNVFAKDAPPPVNKCPPGTATGTREPVPTLVWVTVPTQGDAGQAVLHKTAKGHQNWLSTCMCMPGCEINHTICFRHAQHLAPTQHCDLWWWWGRGGRGGRWLRAGRGRLWARGGRPGPRVGRRGARHHIPNQQDRGVGLFAIQAQLSAAAIGGWHLGRQCAQVPCAAIAASLQGMKLGAALCECVIEDELSSSLHVGKLAGWQASSPGALATAFLQQRM